MKPAIQQTTLRFNHVSFSVIFLKVFPGWVVLYGDLMASKHSNYTVHLSAAHRVTQRPWSRRDKYHPLWMCSAEWTQPEPKQDIYGWDALSRAVSRGRIWEVPKRAMLRCVEMMKRKHATAVIPRRASSMMTLIHICISAFFMHSLTKPAH